MRFLPALALLASVLAACSVTENTEVPPLDLTAVTSPADLKLGDTARVEIDITNSGTREVWIGPAGCNYDFVITSESGKVYHPAETIYCILALMPPVKLAPGETYRIDAFTTGRVIAQGSQDAPSMLEPGTYGIRAVVAILRGDEDEIVVRSNPATVTFRAR